MFEAYSSSISSIAPYAIPAIISLASLQSTTDQQILFQYAEKHEIKLFHKFEPTNVSARAQTPPAIAPLSVATWSAETADAVDELATRDDGWKGEGSVAATKKSVDDTHAILSRLSVEIPYLSKPMVGLDEDGYFNLFWNDQEVMVSLSIYGDGSYSFYAESPWGSSKCDEWAVDQPLADDLSAILGELCEVT